MNDNINKKINEVKDLYLKYPDWSTDINNAIDGLLSYKKTPITVYATILFVILGLLLGLFIPYNLDDGSSKIYYFCGLVVACYLIKIGFSYRIIENIFAFIVNVIGFLVALLAIINTLELKIYLSDSPKMLLIYLIWLLILFITILTIEIACIFVNKSEIKSKLYLSLLVLSFILISMVVFLPKLLPYLL